MASLRVYTEPIVVRTAGKGTYEITDQISEVLLRSGIVTGTLTVFVQHTSCSLIIMENADPTARRDLEEFFDRLVPENASYFEHDSEGPDDMPSHIRMSLSDYHPMKGATGLDQANPEGTPLGTRVEPLRALAATPLPPGGAVRVKLLTTPTSEKR